MANHGSFTGRVIAIWQTEAGPDRTMQITEDFTYTDPSGLVWTAPAGISIDGASIPSFAWSFLSPYIGDYRRASVVHDHYCRPPYQQTWRKTHRMFYNAARADGLGAVTAATMYAAIYAFGPRWADPVTGVMALAAAERDRLSEMLAAPPAATDMVWSQISETEFGRIARWIESDGPTLAQIEAQIDGAPAEKAVAFALPALSMTAMDAAAPRRRPSIALKKPAPPARPKKKLPTRPRPPRASKAKAKAKARR